MKTTIQKLYDSLAQAAHDLESGNVEAAKRAIAGMRADLSDTVSEPFMFAIMDPSGKPHFDEFCVAQREGDLGEAIIHLNSDGEEFKVVPVFA